ncbi:MAG: N-acetylmuramoyl-L-alanine amidase [Bacteroidota bacterium]
MRKFSVLTLAEFDAWLNEQKVSRTIKLVQNHHTWCPSYKHFTGQNHSRLLLSMEASHLERGFAEIGQNLTIFPDGRIAICRAINRIPAGIKGANANGICIECIGNFDAGGDVMSHEQRDAILDVNALLCKRFGLVPSTATIVYHAWYNLTTGERDNDEGRTDNQHKTCPGTAWFGGNSADAARAHFIPEVINRGRR